MDRPNEHEPEDDVADGPATPTQEELEAMLDGSDAEVAAGHTVPLGPVLARMRATAERIRRERAAKETKAHPRA